MGFWKPQVNSKNRQFHHKNSKNKKSPISSPPRKTTKKKTPLSAEPSQVNQKWKRNNQCIKNHIERSLKTLGSVAPPKQENKHNQKDKFKPHIKDDNPKSSKPHKK
jgi:hypothetical protein